MYDNRKTKEQLIQEVEDLRRRITELEKSEAERTQAELAWRLAHDEQEQSMAARTEELRQTNEELQAEITERKLAEEAIQKTLRFRQVLMDAIPSPVFYKDAEGIYLGGNKALEQFWGRSLDQIIGKTVYDISPPDLAEIYERADQELLNNPGVQIYETSVASSRGIRRNVIFNKATFTNDAGKVAGLIGVIVDITERKQAEQSLRESKEQLRILASQILSAQENERKRIALEIHDVLGSALSAIKYKVEDALHLFPKDETLGISKPLEALIPLIQDTIEEIRRIQADLRPSILDDLGIVATLSWLSRRFETIYSGIKIEQSLTIQEEEVPDHLKIVFLRITQEALNNIGKYAKADSVYLGLQKIDNAIELRIEDNGEGFDQENLSFRESLKKGLGLSSMKERVKFSDGSFSIESAKGKGTVIRAVWPA